MRFFAPNSYGITTKDIFHELYPPDQGSGGRTKP